MDKKQSGKKVRVQKSKAESKPGKRRNPIKIIAHYVEPSETQLNLIAEVLSKLIS